MKNKILGLFGYTILLLASLISGYLLLVFSFFFFLGKQVDKEYKNGVLIATFIIIAFLILLFVLFFSIVKIYKNLKKE